MSQTAPEIDGEPHPSLDDDPNAGAVGEGTNWGTIIRLGVLGVLLVALLVASANTGQLGRLGWIALTITIVVGLSAAVFAGSNLMISKASTNWAAYRGLVGAALGAAGFGLLRGNRSVWPLIAEGEWTLPSDDGTFIVDDPNLIEILGGVADPELMQNALGLVGLIEWPIVGAALGGLAGWLTGSRKRAVRLAGPVLLAAGAGWLIASRLQYANRPDVSIGALALWVVIGVVAGGALGAVHRNPATRACAGGALGAVIGGWLLPDLGTGTSTMAIIAVIVPLVLLALRFGWPDRRSPAGLADFTRRARAFVFLAPALGFLSINLIIPALRTIYTSFLDRESEEFVGTDNYRSLFGSEAFLDTSRWQDFFTSQLFLVGVVMVVSGLLIGAFIHRSRNGVVGLERTGGSIGPILIGIFLLLTAAFSVIRGTFANTLWWVLTVTVASTAVGLLIAVLAERAGRLEATAKALVFMPMAISFVGASIIWRFQYQPRNISKNQTGVLNALWVELGRLSHSGWPRLLVLAVLAAFLVVTGLRVLARARAGEGFAGLAGVGIVLAYLIIELARRSLGGFTFDADGMVIAETVAFREEVRPFNNIYLMFIMIWIQSGFAMVILSAAIKAVPQDLLEAARIDGAGESQQFFHVVLPQILPTIGVVVTATMVAVIKVFDIVKVSTGGNFGTNVLANDFFTEAFQFADRGVGSAIAVLILLTAAPILILNVRQMQREGA